MLLPISAHLPHSQQNKFPKMQIWSCPSPGQNFQWLTIKQRFSSLLSWHDRANTYLTMWEPNSPVWIKSDLKMELSERIKVHTEPIFFLKYSHKIRIRSVDTIFWVMVLIFWSTVIKFEKVNNRIQQLRADKNILEARALRSLNFKN